jgi:DNA-binding beta-propeller fold protein YncE
MRTRLSLFSLFAGTLLCCGHSGAAAPDGGDAGNGGNPACGNLDGLVITTNQGDDTLSVIDPDGGQPVCALYPPAIDAANMEMPHELSVDLNGKFFIIGMMEMPGSDAAMASANEIAMMNSTAPGYALEFSAQDGAFLGKVQVDPDPGDNELSADNSVVYVSCFNQPQVLAAEAAGDTNPADMYGKIFAVDTATMTVITSIEVCPEPHILELSPDGNYLFSSCLDDEIAMIDVSNPRAPKLVGQIREGANPGQEQLPSNAAYWPYAQQPSYAAGGQYTVWVSNWNPSHLGIGIATITDQSSAAANSFTTYIPMGSTPVFTTFSTDGSRAYNAHQGPDGVAVFDMVTLTQIDDIPLAAPDCQNPHQVLLSADGLMAAVLCEGDHSGAGQYAILDLTTKRVVSSTPTGTYPVEMRLLP